LIVDVVPFVQKAVGVKAKSLTSELLFMWQPWHWTTPPHVALPLPWQVMVPQTVGVVGVPVVVIVYWAELGWMLYTLLAWFATFVMVVPVVVTSLWQTLQVMALLTTWTAWLFALGVPLV
jgi:hypothetical protein